MGRQSRVGGPPPQGPVPVLAGLMDGNGCSIGTHILSYKPKTGRRTADQRAYAPGHSILRPVFVCTAKALAARPLVSLCARNAVL